MLHTAVTFHFILKRLSSIREGLKTKNYHRVMLLFTTGDCIERVGL